MRVSSFVVVVASVSFAVGCDSCAEDPVIVVDGEGEGDALPSEGEGDVGVGEGEGDVVSEGEGDVVSGEGEGEVAACDASFLTADDGVDKPRTMLVGFPFAEPDGGPGHLVRSYGVDVDGVITGELDAIDVGFVPERIAFSPSGKIAVVLAEREKAATLDVSNPADLRVLANVDVALFGFNDLVITDSVRGTGVVGYAINFDSTPEGGVHPFTLGCDGALTFDTAFLDRRLSSSMAVLPGDRALLLGGQATFGTPDTKDLRLLDLSTGAATETFAFDLFADFVNAGRIGASVDGSFVVIPNNALGSAEAGDIVVVDVAATDSASAVVERGRVTGFASASEALVAPDGTVAAVSQYEDDAVVIVDVVGTPSVVTTLRGLGLAEHMAMIGRGPHAGRIFVPIVQPAGGSFIATVDIGAGVGVAGANFVLGDAFDDIPVCIALTR